ncbi:Os03g0135150, partial [Oryza sativa Japonica Group]
GAVGDLLVPPRDVLLGGEELLAPRRPRVDDVVGVREVGQVGQGELVAGEVLVLRQDLVVHVQHLLQLPLVLRDAGLVGRYVELRRERQVEHQLRARRVEALRLRLQPLLDRRPLQRPRPVDRPVPVVWELSAQVSAYRS